VLEDDPNALPGDIGMHAKGCTNKILGVLLAQNNLLGTPCVVVSRYRIPNKIEGTPPM
jgi:hypothetical protein